MSFNSSDDDYPDAIVTPDADGRIMRSPEEDAVVGGVTESVGPPDIESTEEATDESYTAHMDDDEANPRPAGAD